MFSVSRRQALRRRDWTTVWASLRAFSPVMVDLRPEIRYLLTRRYIAIVSRNTTFSLVLLAIALAGFGREAPLPLIVGLWLSTAALYWVRGWLRDRVLRRLETVPGRSASSVSWIEILPGASMLIWSILPAVLEPWTSMQNFMSLVCTGTGVIAMIGASYVAALPACLVFLAGNGALIVVALLLEGSAAAALLAGLVVVTVTTVMLRVVGLHHTLVQALTTELENASLLRTLQEHREALTSENRQLSLSLLAASDAARHDPLTGLFNRRYVDEAAPQIEEGVASGMERVSVCTVDIDHFKKINDRFGHPIGDEVLRSISVLLTDRLREGDCLARMGGEEFLAVLRDCDLRAARRVAESVRARVSASPLVTTGGDVAVTASIGVAEWRPSERFDEVCGRADRALYRAKETGRDRVVIDGANGAEAGWTMPAPMGSSG